MKFAHLADAHIGAWRDQKMGTLPEEAFKKALRVAVEEGVDFIIIAGDLFHTPLPGIDRLRTTVNALYYVKEQGIPIYAIPGSHDYSPTGKSVLSVLEEAKLLIDVHKGSVKDGKLVLAVTTDEKTGCAITGIHGKRGMLDKEHYEALDQERLAAAIAGAPHKVFVFHASIDELKPKKLEGMPSAAASTLPEGFDYYAGGHVHIIGEEPRGGARIVYPGPVFPASFSELEELKQGNMVIVDRGITRNIPLAVKDVCALNITLREKTPGEATSAINEAVAAEDVIDRIVLLRVQGTIKAGSSADIDFKSIMQSAYNRGAYYCMRNTSGLRTEGNTASVEERSAARIEEEVIAASANRPGNIFGEEEAGVMRSLLKTLAREKNEGETTTAYEERVVEDAKIALRFKQAEE